MHDTSTRYGTVSRALHALIGGLILLQLLAAGAKRLLGNENPISSLLSPYHGDIGIVLLVLVIVRICWAISQRAERPQPTENELLVKVGHYGLYALMFLVPLLGLMIAFGGGRGVDLFGLQLVAAGNEVAELRHLGRAMHKPLGWTLAILVAGHIGMALHHRFVRKDEVMGRMFGRAS